jgi:hypothetical protein
VLRPLFPIKPSAPIGGEYIVVGDELVLRSAKKPCSSSGSATVATCLDKRFLASADTLAGLFST